LEFNVPFQHKYGYIRDELLNISTKTMDLFRKYPLLVMAYFFVYRDNAI